MRIVCIDTEDQYREIVERDVVAPLRAAGHEFAWIDGGRFDRPEEAIAAAQGFDGLYIIGDQGPLPTGLLEQTPSLRLVSFVGTGARRFVDMNEAERAGVTVTNVPDFASQSVAEHAIALMFAVARRVVEGDGIVRSGAWAKNQGLKLAGSRIGVVGAGAIGGRVIRLAKGLGMEPVYWSRTVDPARSAALGAEQVSLEELFETSRVVSVHLTHSPETDRLVSRDLLARLRADAIFVNTARAEVVDGEALDELLDAGRIFGAGIDVFTEEPPATDGLPAIASNVVLTPHIGFHTDEADDVFRLAAENILAFAAGEPTNVIH
ncbi:2-hydroxyacid dehydrogenase [Agromyces sp. NPDC058110]|uniref:2-hydroxyacid dehydrogenase n=1 Tax=Agromyces sp. NPDC058110 TaxID=3346345 RepID=UPI0036D871C6